RWELQDTDHRCGCPGRAVPDHRRAPVSLQFEFESGGRHRQRRRDLQAGTRRNCSRQVRPGGKTAQGIRHVKRDRLPDTQPALCCGDRQLPGAETDAQIARLDVMNSSAMKIPDQGTFHRNAPVKRPFGFATRLKRNVPFDQMQEITFRVLEEEETHTRQVYRLFCESCSGGLELLMCLFKVINSESDMTQPGVPNEGCSGLGVGVNKLQDYAVRRTKIDGLSRIELESEVQMLDIPVGELVRIERSDRNMLETCNHGASSVVLWN